MALGAGTSASPTSSASASSVKSAVGSSASASSPKSMAVPNASMSVRTASGDAGRVMASGGSTGGSAGAAAGVPTVLRLESENERDGKAAGAAAVRSPRENETAAAFPKRQVPCQTSNGRTRTKMTWLVLAVLALAGADDAGTRHVQPRHRRVFVQHVMRADGSLLCAHLRAARGCAYDASANCRPEPSYPPGELPTINLAATAPPGRLYDRAPFRRRESCGLVFDEPAWVHRAARRPN